MNFGFCLPEKLSAQEQSSIIELTMKFGRPDTDFDCEDSEPFWQAWNLRGLDLSNSLSEHVINSVDLDEMNYLCRLNPDLNWHWINTPEVESVKTYLKKIEKYFDHLTRVQIFVQFPGHEIGCHRDLVPQNIYNNLQDSFSEYHGNNSNEYLGTQHFDSLGISSAKEQHKRQKYLGMRIPLSVSPGDPGRPYYYDKGKVFEFSSQNQFFLIDETQYHGAFPSDHLRGVIFVDGILNMGAIEPYLENPLKITNSYEKSL